MAQLGRVYLLFNDEDDTGYVGSTTNQPAFRLQSHKESVRSPRTDRPRLYRLYQHYSVLGEDKMQLRVLETIEYEDIDELYYLERQWLDAMKATGLTMLNEKDPWRSEEEQAEARRLSHREWQRANPEKVAAWKRRYNDAHRAQISAYAVQYYAEHADERRAKRREYHEAHKDDPEYVRKNKDNCRDWYHNRGGKEKMAAQAEERNARKRERRAAAPKVKCDVCGAEVTKEYLATHVRKQHT